MKKVRGGQCTQFARKINIFQEKVQVRAENKEILIKYRLQEFLIPKI